MLTRAEKQTQIDALRDALAGAQGLFVMDFTGLSVGEVTELRRRVAEAEASYIVVKNTLARIAVSGSRNEAVGALMLGPTAVAYTTRDVVPLAKALADFAKGHDKLKFRGGLVEGQLLTGVEAQQIATLPSKTELVAKLLFILQSPMRRLVTALNWPLRSLAVTVQQVADEKARQA
ncbi:MAG: 50S ribosomal protein L10 [Thermoanaerobaculaceae bacterium]|nr:50S ribosomal protein L10 [Thermoanaerobaculaceae bacterium]MDI9622240.1 50S ribosomal protein L10 [Acidobacteriota bacterium]NLH10923.1 50S ribosomal protein L10 [Holophagae bacterium]HPW56823.1 50S ribosomal protein L10 [Thermoanaerobaculaceae bacterium]